MSDQASVYLNQAGTSWPKPAAVQDAAAAVLEADPNDWPAQFESARRSVADFLHIPDATRLLLTPGGTSALAVAVADHAWLPGDRVLTSGLEHHALHRPLWKLAEWGVELTVLPRTEHEPIVLEALEKQLAAGRVRLVAVTAASNVTGEFTPLDEVVRLAHAAGALVLVDAAQTVGWWDIDVPALGADLVAFAGHKALHAPWGIGGLYVAEGVAMNSPAASCEVPHGEAPNCAQMPAYCDTGSVDRVALAALTAAAEWLAAAQRRDRLATAQQQAERLWTTAASLPGVTLYGPRDPKSRLPIVSFTVRGRRVAEVAAALGDRGVFAAAGLQCAPLAHQTLGTEAEGVVRLSVGAMNTEADIDRAVAAIEATLA